MNYILTGLGGFCIGYGISTTVQIDLTISQFDLQNRFEELITKQSKYHTNQINQILKPISIIKNSIDNVYIINQSRNLIINNKSWKWYNNNYSIPLNEEQYTKWLKNRNEYCISQGFDLQDIEEFKKLNLKLMDLNNIILTRLLFKKYKKKLDNYENITKNILNYENALENFIESEFHNKHVKK